MSVYKLVLTVYHSGNLYVEKIKAHFEDGVLEVMIPIKEPEKKHKKIGTFLICNS